MKRIFTLNLVVLSLLVLLFSCEKEPRLPEGVKLPTLSIDKISELPFSNTEWRHVFGGMAEIKYIKGSTTITDSLDLAKLAGYQKTLELGTYDIQLRSKSTAIADTFIRFSAELKGLVVDKGQALSLTATSNDGLITIKKESVKDNSVPTFTPASSGAKSYKLGLIDGYYFIYVAAGTTGKVSFDSKATNDRISKDLNIVAANHYNLVVVTNGASSFSIELQKFLYNEVQVASPTLLTIQMPSIIGSDLKFTFVISDEEGRILNSVKYDGGTTTIKLESKVPYTKDRLSFFVLSSSVDPGFLPRIDAHMNVKIGSTWKWVHPGLLSKTYQEPRPVSLKSIPAFDMMTFSSDYQWFTLQSVQDLPAFNGYRYYFSDGSKIFFQVENEGKAYYHFFDVSKTSQSLDIDPTLCSTPSLSKTISFPGSGQVQAYGRPDKNYSEKYSFGYKRSAGGSVVYFYPNETFQEYYTLITCHLNGISYADSYLGPEIAAAASPINLSFEPNGRSLATFSPTFAGKFDYYKAHFENGSLSMEVISPSAAISRKLVFPDLSAFYGFSEFNMSALTLKNMEAFQYSGFNEETLNYKNYHGYELTGKAMLKEF